jgi:hypothetical protein
MRRVLGYVERLVRRINSLIGSADWENQSLVWSVLTQAESEDRAANESPGVSCRRPLQYFGTRW